MRSRIAYGVPMRKSALSTESAQELPFRLESLVRAETPAGSEGTWYRYVISQGSNQITGVRSGEQAEVTQMVGEMVERLNERRAGKTRPKAKTT